MRRVCAAAARPATPLDIGHRADERHPVTSFDRLPASLPIPVDDGAADHLLGSSAPDVGLASTSGVVIHLDRISGRVVMFGYPRTGTPGQPSPDGWDAIPGARGCTPQACGFRNSYPAFTETGAQVFGISSQASAEQREAAQRLELPYPLMSDSDAAMARAWMLPTFTVDGATLLRRITIFLYDGVVDGVIYPVFPPDRSAEVALAWLRDRPAEPTRATSRIAPRRGLPHPIPPRLVR
ncbi:MAG: peroxiredoxin [Geodermatophilaceae bacterium]|nr:peroxiredoxin [Geodermatophilaceae bacterium]